MNKHSTLNFIRRADGSCFRIHSFKNLTENSISVYGRHFHCGSLLDFCSSASKAWNGLSRGDMHGPSEFTVETWQNLDEERPFLNWKGFKKTEFSGVEWTSARHTEDDSGCCGEAQFSFSEMKERDWDGPRVTLKSTHQNPWINMEKEIDMNGNEVKNDIRQKYEEMKQSALILNDGLSVSVYAPWYKRIELAVSTGSGTRPDMSTAIMTSKLYLSPEDIDPLIERLKISRDMILHRRISQQDRIDYP